MRKLFQALLLGCFDLWEEEEETGVWAGEVAVQYEGRKKKKKNPTKQTSHDFRLSMVQFFPLTLECSLSLLAVISMYTCVCMGFMDACLCSPSSPPYMVMDGSRKTHLKDPTPSFKLGLHKIRGGSVHPHFTVCGRLRQGEGN